MPIKSYLLFPKEGEMNKLVKDLSEQPCEIMPAANREILVMVSDTKTKREEDLFIDKLNALKTLDHFTLVCGFND